METQKKREIDPPIINTREEGKFHIFETYDEKHIPEFDAEDCGEIRQHIGDYFGVPSEHQYSVEDEEVATLRETRAFSVVILKDGQSYSIDGRLPHAVLMRALQNEHTVPFSVENTEDYNSFHGFMDPNGFKQVEEIQEEAERRGKKITWIIRYRTSGEASKNLKKRLTDLFKNAIVIK